MSRKIAFLMGLLLVMLAASAQAAQDYYDNGYRSGSYSDDYAYRNDRYGYSDHRIVRCESRDMRTVYCRADTRGGVRLVDQLSDRRCIRGRTWGVSSRGLWVTDGCRGRFETYERGRSGGSYGGSYGRVIRCESRESRTVYCSADSRSGVRLVAQLSGSPCIEGSTWGIARNGVWVSRGCRAEFRVGNDRYGSNYGYDNRYRDDGYYGDRY
jgi:hypothetical protein